MNRRFQILYHLLQHGKATAPELAELFEVSVRTIYRDVDEMSLAGIPVYTLQGKGGGIVIDSSFLLERTLLTEEERQQLLAAVEALEQTGGATDLYTKLIQLFQLESHPWIQVDFSRWGGSDSFQQLQKGVSSHQLLAFDYNSSKGESLYREVEGEVLWFKYRDWYLWGYCRMRHGYRLFRLSRMEHITVLEERFLPRSKPLPTLQELETGALLVSLELEIDPRWEYRVTEEFSKEQVTQLPNGKLLAKGEFIEDDWLISFVLSFGSGAKVLSPSHIRDKVKKEARKITTHYET